VAIAVTIGASVALIVIGAILRFGVTWQPAHVDLQVIGVILMVAGALGLALSLLFMVIRRNDRRSAQVYEERRYNEPPMWSDGSERPLTWGAVGRGITRRGGAVLPPDLMDWAGFHPRRRRKEAYG